MGHFVLKNKVNLLDIQDKDTLPEADYTHVTKDSLMLQFEYIEEKSNNKLDVDAGLFKIISKNNALVLEKAQFIKDDILNEYTNTEKIEKVIDCFFKNLHLYKEFGIDVPKRNLLLYGPAGTGKTYSLQKAVSKYLDDKKTVAIMWDTYAFDPFEVKEFISTFNYLPGVEKIILIAEDIGGSANSEATVRSSSSLLKMLDNTDKTFTIPIMVIATTNFIENLESNLANRSGRFDDKLEIGYPDANNRVALMNFFSKGTANEDVTQYLKSKACDKLSVAHIKESYIRSRLHEKPLLDVLKDVVKEIDIYNKGFKEQRSMGFVE